MRRKTFRVHHEKSRNPLHVLILQNRTIEAESAEQALHIAMKGRAPHLSIEVRGPHLAVADHSSPDTCYDYWKAELEPYAERMLA